MNQVDQITIAALYKFVSLPDYEVIRESLLAECKRLNIKGTLLLAHEGLNGTIAGKQADIQHLLEYLTEDSRFHDISVKFSYAETAPFHRMKVKLKKEIVTIGLPDIDPTELVGTYVKPKAWNDLISDPEVTLIDTRNDYEYGVGTFKNAINPNTFSFRQFPEYVSQNLDPEKHKKVAMFCTGGIRCEKATSLLLDMGFEEVYHLEGGILKYLEEVPENDSLWSGECFVFDDRVTVDHNLLPGNYVMCYACKRPLAEEETQHPDYQEGVSCQHCIGETTDDQRERFAERHRQVKLAEAAGRMHIGRDDDPQ